MRCKIFIVTKRRYENCTHTHVHTHTHKSITLGDCDIFVVTYFHYEIFTAIFMRCKIFIVTKRRYENCTHTHVHTHTHKSITLGDCDIFVVTSFHYEIFTAIFMRCKIFIVTKRRYENCVECQELLETL